MTFRWSGGAVALFSSLLVALVVVACAEGSDAGDETGADQDADTFEAAAPPRLDASQPEPEQDAGTKEDSGPTTNAACVAAIAAAKFDFEASDQGWTHKVSDNAQAQSPSWPFDPWTRGTATPLPCPAGQCWGAERNQNYAQCGRGELISPKIDLSKCAGENVSLVFTHAFAFWSGAFPAGTMWFDGGIVELSADDGATWAVPSGTYPGTVKVLGSRSGYNCVLPSNFYVHDKSGFTGNQQSPTMFEVQVPAASLTTGLRVRFSQASGVSSLTSDANQSRAGTAAGWRIDDVHFSLK